MIALSLSSFLTHYLTGAGGAYFWALVGLPLSWL